jgi:hypothetical protein
MVRANRKVEQPMLTHHRTGSARLSTKTPASRKRCNAVEGRISVHTLEIQRLGCRHGRRRGFGDSDAQDTIVEPTVGHCNGTLDRLSAATERRSADLDRPARGSRRRFPGCSAEREPAPDADPSTLTGRAGWSSIPRSRSCPPSRSRRSRRSRTRWRTPSVDRA